MQKTSSITLVATPIKTTIWNCTSQTSAVKQWASDLSRVVSAGFKLQDLEMAGRAVLLEHDDIGLAQEYTHFVASEVGVQFVFISCETMLTIDTWLKWIPTDKPTLIYLEPGIWMSKDLSADDDNEWPLIPDFDEDKGISFRVQLINFITRQKLNRKCIFVTAVQTNAQIDTSLKRVGLFDRRIVISNLDYSSKASIFIDRVGIDKIDTSITSDLNRLGCLINHVFPRSRQRELFYKAVQRLAWRKKGKINFKDLIIFATYGTS